MIGEGKHEAFDVVGLGDQTCGSTVQTKRVKGGKQELQHYLQARYGSVWLGHDKGAARRACIADNVALEFDERGLIDQTVGLGIDCVGRESVDNRSERRRLFQFFVIVEFDGAS